MQIKLNTNLFSPYKNYNTPTSKPYLKPIPFDTVSFSGANLDESTKIKNAKLKQIYGIESDIKDENLLNLFYDAVTDFSILNANNRMFEGLQVTTDDLDGTFSKVEYDKNHFKIIYEKDPEVWQNIGNILEDMYNDGDISSTNKKYPVYVSLANYLYYKHDSKSYKENLGLQYRDEEFPIIGRITSEINCGHFDMEYIASRMSGIKCPEQLQRYYETNGGNPNLKLPNNDFIPYVGKKHSFKTIQDAKTHLQKYGIQSYFTSLKQANTVVEAVEDVIEATGNTNIFNGLKIKSIKAPYEKDKSVKAICHMDEKTNEAFISLNPYLDWNDMEKIEQSDYDLCFHPSNRIKDQVIHELIHYLDFKGNPKKFLKISEEYESGERKFNDLDILRTSKVSSYATMDPQEFCAEYVVGKLSGVKYPECTNERFEKWYNGVDIKFPEPIINL